MANSSDLIGAMADMFRMNRSTCASIYREIRAAGLVSNEGRGRNAATMTSRDAATYLLAICGAERVQDAADAVRRYSALIGDTGQLASGMPIPSPTWQGVEREFPRLGALPAHHDFISVIVALIESYIDGTPAAKIEISIRGPYPWASVKIAIGQPAISIWYSDDGNEDGPGQLASIDEAKARQRRKFIALGGDLNITSTLSENTIASLGNLLR
jgi:hypothetical protein